VVRAAQAMVGAGPVICIECLLFMPTEA